MCPDNEEFMADLLAGSISDDDRKKLEAHLIDCSDCRVAFDDAKRGWDLVEKLPGGEPSAELIQNTRNQLAAVRPSAPAAQWWASLFKLGTAAAAAFLFAIVVFVGFPSGADYSPTDSLTASATKSPRSPLAAYVRPAFGVMSAKDAETGRPVGDLSMSHHTVNVEIVDGFAKTEIEEIFQNHTGSRLEATFLFPLPQDASISRLAMEIGGELMEGEVVEREKARKVYESIVRRRLDPALLEWLPGGLFRCRVFPIEPHSYKRLIITYTQALPVLDGKAQYVYPLVSEMTQENPPGELKINVAARYAGGLKSIDCPSHRVDIAKKDNHQAGLSLAMTNVTPKNDFVVTMDLQRPESDLQVIAHKTDGEDGYVVCTYTPRAAENARAPARTIYVVDASASVSAPELAVARRFIEESKGDSFAVIAHNVGTTVLPFGKESELNEFLYKKIRTEGACDLGRAVDKIVELAGDEPTTVVYLGEGTPTLGENNPRTIAKKLEGKKIHWRSIAIGTDSDEATLKAMGGIVRKINPADDVHGRIREIVKTLYRPVVDVKFEFGEEIYDPAPHRIGAAYAGQRVVVTARYRGNHSTITVNGVEHDVSLPVKEEGFNYARRLWAQRRITDLLPDGETAKGGVIELSTKYQIMTPYTSFLVLETEKMYKDWDIARTKKAKDELTAKTSVLDNVKKMLQNQNGKSVGRVDFDKNTNTFVVTAPDSELARVEEYLKKVDKKGQEWSRLPAEDDRSTITEMPAEGKYNTRVFQLKYMNTPDELDEVIEKAKFVHGASPGKRGEDTPDSVMEPELSEQRERMQDFYRRGRFRFSNDFHTELEDGIRKITGETRSGRDSSIDLPRLGIKGKDRNSWGDFPGPEIATERTTERDYRGFLGGLKPSQGRELRKLEKILDDQNKGPKPVLTGGTFQSWNGIEGDGARFKVMEVKTDRIRIAGGSKQGLANGMRLIITRKAKYIALVVIIEVKTDHAFARILPDLQLRPIEAGDIARAGGDPAAFITKDVILELDSNRDLKKTGGRLRAWKEWKNQK